MKNKYKLAEKIIIGAALATACLWPIAMRIEVLKEKNRPISTPVVFKSYEKALHSAPIQELNFTEKRHCHIRLNFVGDIMQHRGQVEDNFKESYRYVKTIFQESDLNVGMLEFPVSPTYPVGPPPYSVQFNGLPEHLEALADAGLNVLGTANNHTLDHGIIGVKETSEQLSKYGLKGVGTGAFANKKIPLIYEVKGYRIAFAAFTFPPNAYNEDKIQYDKWLEQASLHSLNFFDWKGGDREKGKKIFQNYSDYADKHKIDYLIALVHWGEEWSFTPSEDQRLAARDMIDAGFDMVIGSHAHVLNGFELYKEKLIAYSLGNFISDFVETETRTGAILSVTLAKNRYGRTVLDDFHAYATLTRRAKNHVIDILKKAYFGERGQGWSVAQHVLGNALRSFEESDFLNKRDAEDYIAKSMTDHCQ